MEEETRLTHKLVDTFRSKKKKKKNREWHMLVILSLHAALDVQVAEIM
jgi:hypothetical protein